MKPFRFVRNCRRALQAGLAFLIFTAVSTVAVAQDDDGTQQIDAPGLDIEAIVGWDGIVDRSTPVPISLLLNNFSNAPVDAEVWLKDPWRKTEISLGEVYVSEGASRRLTSIQSFQEWNECIVELRDNIDRKTVLWRRALTINTGQRFDSNIKYALIVNNSTRHLDLPAKAAVPVISRTPNTQRQYSYNGQPYSDEITAVAESQSITSLNCKTWQLPIHPAPLMTANAVVFPNGVQTDDLNAAQWSALAKWMCRGGTIFIHEKSQEIVQELLAASPLGDEPPFLQGNFSIRRSGVGSIREFTNPIFDEDSTETEQQIADAIAEQDKHHLTEMIQLSKVYNRESGRADRTRTWIMAFFGIYTLLSSVVTMVFFRKNRRSVIVYIVSLVFIACVSSGVLGGSLRYSRGDVHWISVTRAGVGGAVQYAKLHLQSAGGRNTQMGVIGPNADLQYIATTPNYHYIQTNADRFPPFTRQPSLSPADEDSFQIKVPITPWGRRELNATSFNRELKRLDVELKLSRNDDGGPHGDCNIEIVNTLPFDLTDARICMTWADGKTQVLPTPEPGANGEINIVNNVVPEEYYFSTRLRTLKTGQTFRNQMTIKTGQQARSLTSTYDRGAVSVSSALRTGVTKAWIVGLIPKSPSLELDDDNSDFSSAEEMHFFVQEILPEEMVEAK